MLPSAGDIIPLALALVLPAAAVLLVMPRYIEFLRSRGRTTSDAHKGKDVRVPTPAGPLLIAALVLGEVVAWAFYGSVVPLVLIVVVLSCGLIGLYDDLRGLGGVVKPALLAGVGLFVAVAEHFYPSVYSPILYFPLFTQTGTHYIIFGLIVIASIPVSANAFNMLDAFNGEISGFTAIVSAALVAGIILRAYCAGRHHGCQRRDRPAAPGGLGFVLLLQQISVEDIRWGQRLALVRGHVCDSLDTGRCGDSGARRPHPGRDKLVLHPLERERAGREEEDGCAADLRRGGHEGPRLDGRPCPDDPGQDDTSGRSSGREVAREQHTRDNRLRCVSCRW